MMAGAPGGEVRVDVRLDRETVWLTQAQMAELFGRERSVVTEQIRNVFAECGWTREAMCKICTYCVEEESRLVCLPALLPAGRQTALTQRLRGHEARLAGS